MTTKQALKIIKRFQRWRLGANTKMLDPKIITEALNVLIDSIEKGIDSPA